MRVLSWSKYVVVAAIVALAVLPGAAHAANAYGQVFAGQDVCLECHGDIEGRWQVGSYVGSAHDEFISDVQADPGAIVPAPLSKQWPSPAFGGGFSFGPGDLWLRLGADGQPHQYVSRFRNDAPHALSTGTTLTPIAGPADDFWAFALEYETHEKQWLTTAPASQRLYFQSCGGCHNLGVTRPSQTSYTLASGASMTRSTETSYVAQGIECENCHGTGQRGTDHWTSGVKIVRTKQALDSQVCGQCHVTGTAKEKNYNGGTFSGPNGYTPDRDLKDFFDIYGTQYVRTSPTYTPPSIPATDTRLYPSGHNEGMHHSYYNEWMLSGHARSLRYEDGQLWTDSAEDYCLQCHSGEGFLKSIDYGESGPNDMGVYRSSVASDTLDIECGTCHTVHAKTGEALGLRLPREEICGRCHNSLLPEGREAGADAHIVHPSKEMMEGYGLIGVPRPAEPFMQDAACPDCHMPKTHRTLMSHRFTPMLPGDAEAWGVQENGDSCTPCHPSRSRASLQASLDGWRTSLQAAMAKARKSVDAARARTAGASLSGQALINSAQVNMDFVTADDSWGAHNYPYAKAGLEKAQLFGAAVGASISRFEVTPFDTRYKLSIAFGRLVLGDGSTRAGETVVIEARPRGMTQWTRVAKATTDETGSFACAVEPKGTTAYRARWEPVRGAVFLSAARAVVFRTTTSASVSASRIKLRSTVRIRGSVSPNHRGAKVKVQYRKGSGSWRTFSTRTLSSTSGYSLTWRPSYRGTYYVRTVFSGDASHAGSVSRTLAVRVY